MKWAEPVKRKEKAEGGGGREEKRKEERKKRKWQSSVFLTLRVSLSVFLARLVDHFLPFQRAKLFQHRL